MLSEVALVSYFEAFRCFLSRFSYCQDTVIPYMKDIDEALCG